MLFINKWIIEEEISDQDHKKIIIEEEGSINSGGANSINNNGNVNFNRNGSVNNIHSVEKTMQKYQQLAKDAQSNGDPVLAQNYLQHADHFLRRFNELNERRENSNDKNLPEEKNPIKDEQLEKKH